MLTYREQYRDPRWQKKRLEMMEAAGWACQICGDTTSTLNVHHRRYVKGRMVWEYDGDELRVMCETCHAEEHTERALLETMVVQAEYTHAVVGIVAGYLDANLFLDTVLTDEIADSHPEFFEIGLAAAALEYLGTKARRDVVRELVRMHGNALPPPFRNAVEEWGEP